MPAFCGSSFLKLRKILLLALVLSRISAGLWAQENSTRQAIALKVIDGDTLITEKGEHIRLIGVDAPEYQPHKNKIQVYGKESGEFLRKRIEGKPIRLETDTELYDRYGRTLAYVYDAQGKLINGEIIAEGYARSRAYPPNLRHLEEFNEDQLQARRAQKGLWDRRIGSSFRTWLDNLMGRD